MEEITPEISSPKMTPMMEQWAVAKKSHPDAILLFRMGDFYELFGDDALLAAPILELALTSRDRDKNGLKMAGFPIHAADNYIAKLVDCGHKVALCDQLEDPKLKKGIVKRGITQVLTPGTLIEAESDSHEQCYLLSIFAADELFAIAALDLATASFTMTSSSLRQKILDEVARLGPKELLVLTKDKKACLLAEDCIRILGPNHNIRVEQRSTLEHFSLGSPENGAINLIQAYVTELRGTFPAHIPNPVRYSIDSQILMDQATRHNLDLLPHKKGDKYNLFTVMQDCKTAMGRRALHKAITAPSTDINEINLRHDLVGDFIADASLASEIRESLTTIYDLERLTALAASNRIGPRYLARLRDCLSSTLALKEMLKCKSNLRLTQFATDLPDLAPLEAELARALVQNPPLTLKEGGIFSHGYHGELDELSELGSNGHQLLLNLELRERELTGISSLKIKFTRVFGYYIEVTRTNLDRVPSRYQRKQTIANGERYITEELSELEVKLNSAQEQIGRLEQKLFEHLRLKVVEVAPQLIELSQKIASLDLLSSFAELARRNNWVRPMMLPREHILVSLEGGRHPIVEQRCLRLGSYFVANDIELDKAKCSLALITGPNMAGKSTIMRQVALIQIMAQMGSYVPATKASLSICDSIFARVGASDDLSLGRSTFMVEMAETSNILQNATPYSLILLDEIGRGTSTYDGMSIAQAVAEYIHDILKSRTLFATHYHELTELEKNLDRFCNFHVEVEERAESVHFLYRLKSGPALKSFGIQVAKLAGLPEVVLERAQEVLAGLEKSEKPKVVACLVQPDLFKVSQASQDAKNILEQIARLDLNRLTPLQALNKLYTLQQRLLMEINAPN